MNKPGKYKQTGLIAGLVPLLSLSLLASAPFERNLQDCQMVSITIKRKRIPASRSQIKGHQAINS